MNSRAFVRWSRLHERRARAWWTSPWLIAVAAGGGLAAFVQWRGDQSGVLAASHAWLGGTLAAFAVAFMRVPFQLYWRTDAALLAQLPIDGGALFDAALLRCLRAATATLVVAVIAALPMALLSAADVAVATRELAATPIAGQTVPHLTPIELFVRHVMFAGVLGTAAGGFLPAVATWGASLVAYGQTARGARTLNVATAIAGASPTRAIVAATRPQAPTSSGAVLGALPGFASSVVFVLVLLEIPWLHDGEPALPIVAVFGAIVAGSMMSIIGVRANAPRVMGTILRDVSALDRQRLATLEIKPPTALESVVAKLLGTAGLSYRKDARLMRRRYPMAYALGALAFLVLLIVALSRPADPTPWFGTAFYGATAYGLVLANRLRHPPIELPRLAATLPIAPATRTYAKIAWVVTWWLLFVGVPGIFALVRVDSF